MPNHVANSLLVSGDKKEIEKFKEFSRVDEDPKEVFNICRFLPMPKELENTESPEKNNTKEQREKNNMLRKKYGHSNWYDWAIVNWGTKWGTYNSEIMFEDNSSIRYRFETAWSTISEEVFLLMSKKFPTLEFDLNFEEPGVGFEGRCLAEKGRMLLSFEQEMDFSNEEEDGI